jgi:hypothetical protein
LARGDKIRVAERTHEDINDDISSTVCGAISLGFLLKLYLNSLNVIFQVFTAVTMKNAVFWDIKTQFVPHRRHVTSPLQSPAD